MQTQIRGNDLWSRNLNVGDEILCEAGILWVTVGERDVVLQAGEHFRLESDAEVMTQALSTNNKMPRADFRLSVNASAEQTARRSGRTFSDRFPLFRTFHSLGRYRFGRQRSCGRA